ncbi:MAG TPA: PA2779 family protein [Burkholderiales bacterium]
MNNKEMSVMSSLRACVRSICGFVAFAFLAVAVHVPIAAAALVGTEAAVGAAQARTERARVQQLLEREEVKRQLLAAGVAPSEIGARVSALSDAEVSELAARIEALPAGGDGFGVILFVFVVLVITDYLGFTDVFPFVRAADR